MVSDCGGSLFLVYFEAGKGCTFFVSKAKTTKLEGTMKQEVIDYHVIDCLLNQKPKNDEIPKLNDESIQYLKKIRDLYYAEAPDKIEKYQGMLEFTGKNEVTKICRDIRQCIINLQREPYFKEYDNSERELESDICYINTIIGISGK